MTERDSFERAGFPVGSLAVAVASALILVTSIGLLYHRLSNRRPEDESCKQTKAPAQKEDQEQLASKRVPVVVLYGTQTGTAEGYARTVSKELRHSVGGKADVTLADLDEYGANDEQYCNKLGQPDVIALLLLATYGDGEPTDNAARFCRLLARLAEEAKGASDADKPEGSAAPSTQFPALAFAVFGLGNRQYEHFNAVATAVDKQLAALGATRLLDLSLGDDDQCLEDDFEAWKASVGGVLGKAVADKWDLLNKGTLAETEGLVNGTANGHANGHLSPDDAGGHLGEGEEEEEDDWETAVHGLDVVFFDEGSPEAEAAKDRHEAFCGGEHWHGNAVTLFPMAQCRELHSEASPRSCLHVELDLTQWELAYTAGDHVAVFPQNEDADVAKAAELLGLTSRLQQVFCLRTHRDSEPDAGEDSTGRDKRRSRASALGSAFFSPLRLDTALRCLVDLHSSPKKASLLLLAQHAQDPAEAQRLKHLASKEGRGEYLAWVLHAHRSLLEVLQAFPSSRPPLPVFLTALAPRLQPRFYSISSSLSLYPGRLSITCAVVDDVTPGGRQHRGVCSYSFKRGGQRLQAGTSSSPAAVVLPAFIRPSTFRLPPSPLTPVIMIGPGTGVAPFRGFLQERMALVKGGQKVGPTVLFFGCRTRTQDFIYSEELEQCRAAGALSDLQVAFSREGSEKVYVQHLLLKQAPEVWRLWHKEGGFLYVCGDAKNMAKDVHATLVEVVEREGGLTSGGAEAMIREMQHEGRYLRDVW